VDDLQWCDGESCALLHFLSRRWAAAPVALVVALTLGEAERAAPAARLARALCSEGHARIVTLAALSDTDVRTLIRQLGKLHDPRGGARFAARIHAVTKGNPFYIVELLKTLFAQGLLAVDADSGVWTAGPEVSLTSGHFPLPPSVRDAVSARIEHLPYQLRDLLTTAAVVAGPCRAGLMSLVHGISRLHAAALCDELVERHLLVEEGGAFRCAHPLIADVVRGETTPSRRREVHRAIALALLREASDGRSESGRIAWHAARAGEHAMAYRHGLLASEECAGRYAYEEALQWLDIAAGAAADDGQREEVNRRTAGVLDQAGWSEPPRVSPARDSQGAALHAEDLDFPVLVSDPGGRES
jgi:predicted ATPase